MSQTNDGALQSGGQRWDYISLALATDAEREEVMLAGVRPDPAKIAGWEFRGYNTLGLTGKLGFRKFKKGFYQEDFDKDPALGLNGYNVQVVQNDLHEQWFDRIKGGNSIKHAWYDVYPVDPGEVDNKYPNALLINYDSNKNLPVDPSRRLRDYIVCPYPDDEDLMLGKAYFAVVGPVRVFASYFILHRENRSTL